MTPDAAPLQAQIAHFSAPPVVDGVPDESVWDEAAILGSFVQVFPDEGAAASESTEVRIGYDATALYVAAWCKDSRPDKLVARVLRRDADLSNDDRLEVHLDTFLDHDTAFLFVTNPAGAQQDGQIRANGDEVRWEWDGTWTAATRRTDDGWTVELAIPFSTLRFQGSAPAFGLNVVRFVSRAQELSSWSPMGYTGGFGTAGYRVSSYGELDGLTGVRSGGHLELRPHASVGATAGIDGGPIAIDDAGGADLKLTLTPNLVADLTVNPDFAESEVQQLVTGVIGVSRFGVFLPEKREFFKEGANLFTFGDRPDPYFEIPERFLLFHSRTLGVAANGVTPVPVYGGARLTGKVGPVGIGVMDLVTAPLVDPATGVDEPLRNASLLRLTTDLPGGSSVGLMATNRQDDGGSYARSGGADADVWLGSAVRVGGYVARTLTSERDPFDDWIGNGEAQLLTPHFELKAAYTDIGTNFAPELGYVTRTGIRKALVEPVFVVTPRHREINHVYLAFEGSYATDRDGAFASRTVAAEVFAPMASGHSLAYLATDQVEVLDAPYTIYPGVVVPPGEVHLLSNLLVYGSDYSKPLGAIVWLDVGPFWGGVRLRNRLLFYVRPLRGIALEGDYERQAVWFSPGNFVSHVVSSTLTVSPTRTFTVRGTVEYASDDRLGVQGLLDWTYSQNADIYLVYSRSQDLWPAEDPSAARPWLDNQALTLKLTSYWGH